MKSSINGLYFEATPEDNHVLAYSCEYENWEFNFNKKGLVMLKPVRCNKLWTLVDPMVVVKFKNLLSSSLRMKESTFR